MLLTGLRVSELSRLRLVDIVLPHRTQAPAFVIGSVRVIGRGSHSRTVTLNAKACEALTDYLAEREKTDSRALLLTKFGDKESTKKSGVSHQARCYPAWTAGRSSLGSVARRCAVTGEFSTRVYL